MIEAYKIVMLNNSIKIIYSDNLYGILYRGDFCNMEIYHNELLYDDFYFSGSTQYEDINTCIEYLDELYMTIL